MRRIIMGCGLIALDITPCDNDMVTVSVGGTCGNVLAILSALGWTSFPLISIGRDAASREAKRDLLDWGVSFRFSTTSRASLIPTIFDLKDERGDESQRRYSFRCQKCGGKT